MLLFFNYTDCFQNDLFLSSIVVSLLGRIVIGCHHADQRTEARYTGGVLLIPYEKEDRPSESTFEVRDEARTLSREIHERMDDRPSFWTSRQGCRPPNVNLRPKRMSSGVGMILMALSVACNASLVAAMTGRNGDAPRTMFGGRGRWWQVPQRTRMPGCHVAFK